MPNEYDYRTSWEHQSRAESQGSESANSWADHQAAMDRRASYESQERQNSRVVGFNSGRARPSGPFAIAAAVVVVAFLLEWAAYAILPGWLAYCCQFVILGTAAIVLIAKCFKFMLFVGAILFAAWYFYAPKITSSTGKVEPAPIIGSADTAHHSAATHRASTKTARPTAR